MRRREGLKFLGRVKTDYHLFLDRATRVYLLADLRLVVVVSLA